MSPSFRVRNSKLSLILCYLSCAREQVTVPLSILGSLFTTESHIPFPAYFLGMTRVKVTSDVTNALQSTVTNARHDSEHLHTNTRAGGPQILSFIHLLNARKMFLDYFPCTRHCIKYWGFPRLWGIQRKERDLNKQLWHIDMRTCAEMSTMGETFQ